MSNPSDFCFAFNLAKTKINIKKKWNYNKRILEHRELKFLTPKWALSMNLFSAKNDR